MARAETPVRPKWAALLGMGGSGGMGIECAPSGQRRTDGDVAVVGEVADATGDSVAVDREDEP